MRYKIAIVEDDPLSTKALKDHFDKFSKEENVDFEFFIYTDGVQIAFDYEAKYDVIFLDIEMKLLDGMEAAKKIREFDPEVIIIFVTNMSQYAVKGYTVDALSFLLKPVPYFAFKQELKKSIEKLNKTKDLKHFLIPVEDGFKRISSNDILYIESIKHDLIIVTRDLEYQIRGTLKHYENELSGYSFKRCNNGYLVNLAFVTGVKDEFAIVDDKYNLKISRPRKKQFMEALTEYLGDVL